METQNRAATAQPSQQQISNGNNEKTIAQHAPHHHRLQDEIDLAHADIIVLICCAITGMCDSVAFNAGSVFVGMQTGNTIFLALGTAQLPLSFSSSGEDGGGSGGPHLLWLKALLSIASFCLGCFVFARVSRFFHQTRRSTLAISFLVQGVLIFVAAALAQSGVAPSFRKLPDTEDVQRSRENQPIILLPIALLAFQFGGQIVSSRILGVNEVPTNVLTSTYCDLFRDANLFAPLGRNAPRNRRVVSVVLLIVGGIVGSWIQRSQAGMSPVLWLAGAIKVGMAVGWVFWPTKKVEERQHAV